jgi:hypothetical protein
VPGTALVVHELKPIPDVDVQDMSGKGVLYKASFLRVLADTAGIHTIATRRMDDESDAHRCDMEVAVEAVDLLLRRSQFVGRYELDLRDGSERANTLQGRAARMLSEKRQHITSQATTGAWCRAVVDALALRRGFPKDEANGIWLPIYVPRVEVHAPSAPPGVAEEISRAAVAQLYGLPGLVAAPAVPAAPAPEPAPQLPPPEVDTDQDPAAHDDPVPFADEPPEDVPPAEDTSRPITPEEEAHLRSLGCWSQKILKRCGWTDGRPSLAVYRQAVAMFGGAPE